MRVFHILCVFFMGFFVILSGCTTIGIGTQGPGRTQYHRSGPPPHAPAHGYRHKNHDGHELEYNSKLGVYVVAGMPEIYFGNNLYIRLSSDDRWQVSSTLNRGWRPAGQGDVPYQLRFHHEKNKHQAPEKHKKKKN